MLEGRRKMSLDWKREFGKGQVRKERKTIVLRTAGSLSRGQTKRKNTSDLLPEHMCQFQKSTLSKPNIQPTNP